MFYSLPYKLREYNLPADVRTLLLLNKAAEKGLLKTLGDIFILLKAIVVKDPTMIGPYSAAFYSYFLNINILPGEKFSDAIARSDAFQKWKGDNLDRFGDDLEIDDLVDIFLSDVHLTTYDIKKTIDGRKLWDADDPYKQDESIDLKKEIPSRDHLEEMADYSDLSLQELLERMNDVMERQKGKHHGGSHWIGTGGTSPYGHGGAAKDGIRVSGSGGGKMARKVINDRKYYPVDLDTTLNDNNIDAALSSLDGILEESAFDALDIPVTIQKGLKRGGLFLPEMVNRKEKKLQVLLLIDNGGYSMDPYIRPVQTLFRKMKTRFAHDLETYFFHNTIYNHIYTDSHRSKYIPIDTILTKNKDYRVFIIGDASMAPYELTRESRDVYKALSKKFKKIVWLNPEQKKYWKHTFSIQVIKELVDMYPLTIRGIEEAVREMNKKK